MSTAMYSTVLVAIGISSWLAADVWAWIIAFSKDTSGHLRHCTSNSSAISVYTYTLTLAIAGAIYVVQHLVGYFYPKAYDTFGAPVYALFQAINLLFLSVFWPAVGILLLVQEHFTNDHCEGAFAFTIYYVIAGALGIIFFSLPTLLQAASGNLGLSGDAPQLVNMKSKASRKEDVAEKSRAQARGALLEKGICDRN